MERALSVNDRLVAENDKLRALKLPDASRKPRGGRGRESNDEEHVVAAAAEATAAALSRVVALEKRVAREQQKFTRCKEQLAQARFEGMAAMREAEKLREVVAQKQVAPHDPRPPVTIALR